MAPGRTRPGNPGAARAGQGELEVAVLAAGAFQGTGSDPGHGVAYQHGRSALT
jgi:hypothetical protein